MNQKYKPTQKQIDTYIAIEKSVSFGNDANSQKIKKEYIKQAIKVLYMRNYMKEYMSKKRAYGKNK